MIHRGGLVLHVDGRKKFSPCADINNRTTSVESSTRPHDPCANYTTISRHGVINVVSRHVHVAHVPIHPEPLAADAGPRKLRRILSKLSMSTFSASIIHEFGTPNAPETVSKHRRSRRTA